MHSVTKDGHPEHHTLGATIYLVDIYDNVHDLFEHEYDLSRVPLVKGTRFTCRITEHEKQPRLVLYEIVQAIFHPSEKGRLLPSGDFADSRYTGAAVFVVEVMPDDMSTLERNYLRQRFGYIV